MQITIKISQELAQMTVAEFSTITKCLEKFDAILQNFNKLSVDLMTTSLAIKFLKTATSGNEQL